MNKQRRGWHDMMAGSKVVVKRKHLLFLGLPVMAILLLVNAAAVKAVWDKAKSNSSLYQEIIQDIGESIKPQK